MLSFISFRCQPLPPEAVTPKRASTTPKPSVTKLDLSSLKLILSRDEGMPKGCSSQGKSFMGKSCIEHSNIIRKQSMF